MEYGLLPMRLSAILLLTLWLGSCVTAPTAESNLFVACKSYVVTLRSLAVFRDELNTDQVEAINSTVEIIGPLCRDATMGKIADMEIVLIMINKELRRLLLIEREVK